MEKKDKNGIQTSLRSFSFGKEVRAGIVLGYTHLTIVIARSHSEKEFEILAWGKEPYGEGVNRNSPSFHTALKPILSRYLKRYKKVAIWCMIQSKGVETRFLVLPDMAPKHLPKAVFWTFKKEVDLGKQEMIFDFDVTGSRQGQDKKELEIMACSAPAKDIQEIRDLFKRAGWPLAGVTVTSFAFQNMFRTGFAGQGSRNIGTLFIGTDWSRIDIFSNGNLILSRDIKTGTRSMTEVIDEQIKEEKDEGISIDAYLKTDEPLNQEIQTGSESEKEIESPSPLKANHFFGMIHDGDQGQLNEVFEKIHPVVDRLIRQIERTFDHFSMTCKGERVERLYFTGPLCAFSPLLSYTEKQLGVPVSTLSPFEKEGTGKQKNIAEIIEQDDYVPSTGLALSSLSRTLNFNFIYKDKQLRRWNGTASKMLFLALVLLGAVGLFSHLGLDRAQSLAKMDIQILTKDLSIKEALYGKTGILNLSKRIIEGKERGAILAKTHQSAAALADITLLLPRDVKLTAFEYEERDMTPDTAVLKLKGLVFSQNRQNLDMFIDKLSASSFVKSVTLTHVNDMEHKEKKGFYFETTLEFK